MCQIKVLSSRFTFLLGVNAHFTSLGLAQVCVVYVVLSERHLLRAPYSEL